MDEFAVHANHNHTFYEMVCKEHPDTFFDWKIIALFYVSFHYLQALAKHRKKNIGTHHVDINNNIRSGNPSAAMPISNTAFKNYMYLFQYSRTARYDGIVDMTVFQKLRKADHDHACKCFRDFRKYIITSGVKLEETK